MMQSGDFLRITEFLDFVCRLDKVQKPSMHRQLNPLQSNNFLVPISLYSDSRTVF
jgi:hypothetical protein